MICDRQKPGKRPDTTIFLIGSYKGLGGC